jgi:drug/metabolite transporter (DMT)-like permease
MLSPAAAHALLHLTVFIWGFTAILGKLISVNALALVWYRQIIAVLFLGVLFAARPKQLAIARRDLAILFGAAFIVSAHWVLFYAAIKLAGIALAVVCLSTCGFFVSIIEPLLYKRPFRPAESVLGIVVLVAAIFLVRGLAGGTVLAIALSLGAAFGSALFGTINGVLTKRLSPGVVAFYELLGGALWMSLALAVFHEHFVSPAALSTSDMLWLSILGVVCTAVPWLTSLRVLQTLSPFTVALALNFEPVYSLVLAWFVFPSSERFDWSFYVGVALLLIAVGADARLKARPASK